VQDITKAGGQASAVATDVTKHEDVDVNEILFRPTVQPV